jgi:hypothetical protein
MRRCHSHTELRTLAGLHSYSLARMKTGLSSARIGQVREWPMIVASSRQIWSDSGHDHERPPIAACLVMHRLEALRMRAQPLSGRNQDRRNHGVEDACETPHKTFPRKRQAQLRRGLHVLICRWSVVWHQVTFVA